MCFTFHVLRPHPIITDINSLQLTAMLHTLLIVVQLKLPPPNSPRGESSDEGTSDSETEDGEEKDWTLQLVAIVIIGYNWLQLLQLTKRPLVYPDCSVRWTHRSVRAATL